MGYFVEQLTIGLSTGAIYAIIAIGFNLVFGVMNVLNLAYGATMMVGTYGLLLVWFLGVRNFWLAAIGGIVAATLVGLIVERVAVRPMKGNWWNTKVATLGFAFFVENFVTRITEGRSEPFPKPFEIVYFPVVSDIEISNVQILLVVASLVLVAAMVAFLRKTKPGKAIRIIAQSPDIAECLGIDVHRITVLGFALSAALGGIAGILNALTFGSTYPYVGQFLGLKGLVVLIVAGIGNMRGCLYVGVVLGLLESLTVGFGGSTYRDLVAYGGMTLILLIRPYGLFGEEGRVAKEI